MTRSRRRPTRVHAAILVGATVLLAGLGGTAVQALWGTSATTSASVRSASIVVATTGFDQLGGAITSQSASRTASIIVANAGSVTSPWTGVITTTTSTDADRALARATTVTAWPATSAGCTSTASVGSGSASGTWSTPPRLSGTLAAGAKATWCVRTTTAASATTSAASVKAAFVATLGTGTWADQASVTATQTTAAPAVFGGFTCTPNDGNWYVNLAWDTSTAPLEANYGVMVNGTRIAKSQGYYGKATLSGSEVPASLAPDGKVRVTVDLLDSSDRAVRQVAGGSVVAFTQSGARGFRCS